VGDVDPLDPNELKKLLASLDIAHARIMDVVLGKALSAEEVELVRAAVRGTMRTLNALDSTRVPI
jgi:hypothetical protein